MSVNYPTSSALHVAKAIIAGGPGSRVDFTGFGGTWQPAPHLYFDFAFNVAVNAVAIHGAPHITIWKVTKRKSKEIGNIKQRDVLRFEKGTIYMGPNKFRLEVAKPSRACSFGKRLEM